MTLRELHWSLYLVVWTLGVTLVGALGGLLLFLLGGLAMHAQFSPSELALSGARQGGFLFFVWGMPIAIIACVVRGYRRRHPDSAP